MSGPIRQTLQAGVALLALTVMAASANAQHKLTPTETLAAPGAEVLVFSNWYDGLFADAKISGVEIVLRGDRLATNGDVRLSSTPGQWDPIGQFGGRSVDPTTGAIEAKLGYAAYDFAYRVTAVPEGKGVRVSVVLDKPLPAALAGKAGFNLEFKPSAFFHRSFMADGVAHGIPLHPVSAMIAGGERQPSSGRDVGPGAEPQAMASGRRLTLAPEDANRRVTVESASGSIDFFDGRAQAQNGWFVMREMIPSGKTGAVVSWLVTPQDDANWRRPTVIGHSQLGYAPAQPKVAVIEADRAGSLPSEARLVRIAEDGSRTVALAGPVQPWGDYLRYLYARFDFSTVREPGLYALQVGDQESSTFRIADGIYGSAWHASNDVFMAVQMDHMLVNEGYRVWHGDPHRDDARQAPVNHEHIDLYRQGPTTDTKFQPGEHIPGLAVGGWLDAGDFDIRTQTNYGVVRSLVASWEQHRPTRDTVYIDQKLRRTELHVADGKPDILQQIAHGTLQLLAQFDAVGHAIHGIVEPDVAQYTHLGDAASKTDGLIYDSSLAFGEEKDGRSGTPDDRWAFTSKSSALNYGSAAALAAAARALAGHDDALATRARDRAIATWANEWGRAPDIFVHGNTTGGPLVMEQFRAAVELLALTKDKRYADAVDSLWPEFSKSFFGGEADTAVQAIPFMPRAYAAKVKARAASWWAETQKAVTANPYGVPITTGGWAGSGAVVGFGLNAFALHRAFPDVVPADPVFRALDFLHGTHPGHNLSLVSGVGTRSKEVAYGSNRADFSYIAGGVVPGVLIVKPDIPENTEDWPFFWGQNEYVINLGASYIELAHAADVLAKTGASAKR